MMRKLLKHEFIATGRIMVVVYAIVALALGYIAISYAIKTNTGEPTILQALSTLLALVVSCMNIYFTIIVLIVNFQKSLYSDQGYLSYTLPVKGVSLLASKTIVSIFWIFLSFVCLSGTAMYTYSKVIPEGSEEIADMLLELFAPGASFHVIIMQVVVWVIKLFIILTMLVMALYFSITLANTRHFQRLHVLWTIVFICVITIISIILLSKSDDIFNLYIVFRKDKVSITGDYDLFSPCESIVSAFVALLMGAGFFFGTFTLMSKKVNIA